jgi:type VI secretion system protein ImpL
VSVQQDLPKAKPRLGKGFFLGIIATMAAIAVAIILGWWERSGRPVGEWAWRGDFALLILGVILAVASGSRALREFLARYREQRFLTGLRASDTATPGEGVEDDQRRLREQMQEAIRTLQQSPDLRNKGGLPLYAVPWYLLIGPGQSGKTTLLRAVASSFPPFERPTLSADAPTQNCDWWFFNTAIVLDTAGSYALPAKGERDSAQWFRFLQLLRYYRELLPINGLIVAVGADMLATTREEELRLTAGELRRRIDEAIRELGVDFPIYLLVTRCDLIEGFTEFFGCLPESVQKQALGHMWETRPGADQRPSEATAAQGLGSVPEKTVERLSQLRLSIFNAEKLPPASLRQKIYCFPEEFRALRQPLSVFVEALVVENPFQHRPFFRGLFFSSAKQQGTPQSLVRRRLRFTHPVSPLSPGSQPHFLHDLFSVILPRDQYLARRTGRAIRGRLFRHLSLFGVSATFSVLLLLLLTWTFFRDRAVFASVDQAPCVATPGPQGTAPQLAQAEGCRQVVQGLVDRNRQRFAWGKLVFNRSGRLERELRQRYVAKFQSEVLAPLDAGLGQQLTSGSETIPLAVLLIKRIELINRCRAGYTCPQPTEEDLQPDYRLMLAAGTRQPPTALQINTLRATYEAYLAWAMGSGEILQQEQTAHADRLRRWFSAKQFAPQQILLWANQQYTPVTLQAFWKGAPSRDGRRSPQVDGAYTAAAWKQSIVPFLERAGDAVPELASHLKGFQDEYRRRYFEQWQQFLAEFPQGEAPWWRTRDQRHQLALMLLNEQSPYNRVVDATVDELKPLLPAMMAAEVSLNQAAEGQPTGTFVRVLTSAWGTVSRLWERPPPSLPPVAPQAGTEPSVPDWVRALLHYLRPESRTAYLNALKELRQQLGQDMPAEKSFQLAQAAFQEGPPSEKSAHPVFKAWWLIEQLKAKEGSADATLGKSIWPLLERPVLIAWKVILEGCGEFMQKAWAENVVAPTKGLSELEQAEFLYGPQGKVREFVGKFAKPFLGDNESRLAQSLGEEVPLAPAFLKTLKDEKRLKPILELGGKTPYQVRVDITQGSVIMSQTNLLEEKTEFQIECEAKTFKASNQPQVGAEAGTTVFWSADGCGDTVVTVSMSCDRRCVERATAVGIAVSPISSLSISKRYKGPGGFLRFLQDFSGGARTFTPGDFAESYAPAEWQQLDATLRPHRVNAIRVTLRPGVPSTLAQLMSLLPTAKAPAAITK